MIILWRVLRITADGGRAGGALTAGQKKRGTESQPFFTAPTPTSRLFILSRENLQLPPTWSRVPARSVSFQTLFHLWRDAPTSENNNNSSRSPICVSGRNLSFLWNRCGEHCEDPRWIDGLYYPTTGLRMWVMLEMKCTGERGGGSEVRVCGGGGCCCPDNHELRLPSKWMFCHLNLWPQRSILHCWKMPGTEESALDFLLTVGAAVWSGGGGWKVVQSLPENEFM